MKPLLRRIVQFRTRPETEKPGHERSAAGKVAALLGGAAVLGGAYAYNASRPSERKHRAYIARAAVKSDPVRAGRLAATSAIMKGRATPYTGPMQGPTPIMKGPAPKRGAAVLQSVSVKSKAQAASDQVAASAKKKPVAQTVKVGRFHAIVRPVQFQDRNRDGTMGVSTNPLSAYRKASRVVPWVNRGAEAAGDIGDIAAGKKVERPFYKKPWFKRAALTAAVAAPILAGKLAQSGERKIADNVKPLTRQAGKVAYNVDRVSRKAATGKAALKRKLGLSAKPNKLIVALQAHARLVQFASGDALDRGWDLRDARGRSARVYAPGSRRRQRREKEWGEKTDNIRLVRNVAIGAAVAGGAGAAILGRKAKINARTLKTQYRQKITKGGGPRMPAKADATGALLFPKRS